MEIEEAFTTYLLAQTGLTALIGNRIYPDERPQGSALPNVIYLTISDYKNHTLTGQDGLEEPYIQFSIFALTKAAAKAVSNQLKTALCDYQGSMSGLTVQYCELVNEMSGLYEDTDGTAPEHTIYLEFQFHYVKE